MDEIKTEEVQEVLDKLSIFKRKFWYERTFILFEMLNWMSGRESVFLCKYNWKNNVRYMNIGSIEMLMKHLGIQTKTEKENNQEAKDPFRFFLEKKNYSIYCSLGKIDWEKCPIKTFSYAIRERIEQQKVMKERIQDYMTDFTGAIDFDGDQFLEYKNGKLMKVEREITQEESVNRALKELKQVIEIFKQFKIKYFVHFSGARGFHIFYEIPLEISINQKCDLASDILITLSDTLNLQTLDRTRFNIRKVFKCPYSLVTTKGITRVVLPLDDNQINNFDLNEMEVSWVYHHISGLKNRGFLWRNEKIYKSEQLSLFNMFLSEFEIKVPEHKEYK